MEDNTSPFATWNFILILYNFDRNNSGVDMNRFKDMTLLLAPVSIRNLKEVPLTDASANQASPKFFFNNMTSDLGFDQVV